MKKKLFNFSVLVLFLSLGIFSCRKASNENKDVSSADIEDLLKMINEKSGAFISKYSIDKSNFKAMSGLDPHDTINFRDFLGEIHNQALDTIISRKTEILDTLTTYELVTQQCETCTTEVNYCSTVLTKITALTVNFCDENFSNETIRYSKKIFDDFPIATPASLQSSLDTAIVLGYMTTAGKSLISTYEYYVSMMEDYEQIINYSKYYVWLIETSTTPISTKDKVSVFSYVAVSKFSAFYWKNVHEDTGSPWGPTNVWDPYTGADRRGCYIMFQYCTDNPDNPLSNWGNGANHCCAVGAAINSAWAAFGLDL